MIKDFSSLHGHSHFSFFDGLSTPEENVKAAKEKGLKSIALTDHGTCHGHADFYLAGKKHGVRTIFGVEAYVIHDLKQWQDLKDQVASDRKKRGKGTVSEDDIGGELIKTNSKFLKKKGHLVLLACNRTGLENLYQLVFGAFKDGFYGKPRMDKAMLKACSSGLVASSACMGGVVSKACWDFKDGNGTWEDVIREAREFDEIFGRGRFFLELQLNEHPGQKFINTCMVRISQETGIPLTVTTDFHYSKAEEWEPREILHMLDWDKTIKDMPGGKIDAEIKQLYVKSPEEMWRSYELFAKDHIDEKTMVEAFGNTVLIDSLVEDFEPDTRTRLPTLPYDNPLKELGQRCIEGLKTLGVANDERYKTRLLYELGVIRDKGFMGYFLTTQRIVQEARKTMLIGAGRGSAAGGLVCYALGITDLDPVAYDLMFERFMDPSRSDLPDIDIDFENVGETKQMLRRMFGSDNVACLSVYGTFQIKGLLKDVGRVFDVPKDEINVLNRLIDKELKVLLGAGEDKSSLVIKFEDVKRVSASFRAFAAKYPQVAQHLEAIYGRNRHAGRHASGVIIGDNLPRETALWVTSKKKRKAGEEDEEDDDVADKIVQTSFTEGIVNKNLQAMGFVKFDILSIATLKVIHYALRLVSKKTGVPLSELRESIRPHRLDMNDLKVLKHVFWEGNMCGVFQFTNAGIRRLAKQVQPEAFDDVSAVTSLYRPGPLASGMAELFVKNKRQPENVVYEHPILEDLLKSTRGTMIFQEQLMLLCNRLGKMELKDVQRIRKNLLKKIKGRSEEFLKAEDEELSGKFVKGCVENGLTDERAREWWANIKGWGSYGFNKSHSHTYSVMTMQCAFLATYHPLEFYTAVLARAKAGEKQDYISDIKKQGIEILPVDVNFSKVEHSIEGTGIRLSISTVKGVGAAAAEKIVANQPYVDFTDFLLRSGVGKTAIEPLVIVGAFDRLYPNMGDLDASYAIYANDANYKRKTRSKKKDMVCWEDALTLFSSQDCFPDYRVHEKIAFENELQGFSVYGSPFEILGRLEKIEYQLTRPSTIVQFLELKDFIESDHEVCRLPVVVKDVKERAQKNGQMMAWVKFGSLDGTEFESPAFSTVWKWIKPKTKRGSVYVVTFNRKGMDEDGLGLGRPGFSHSMTSAQGYMIDLDELQIQTESTIVQDKV